MTRRRGLRPPRTRLFIGCEGHSEEAYAQLLQRFADQARLPIHLEVVRLNPGAGDPPALVTRAVKEAGRRWIKGARFRSRILMLDSDRLGQDGVHLASVETRAAAAGFFMLWQDPCHEAFLLRHLDGFAQHRPPTPAAAEEALRRQWPEYKKPMTRMTLERRLDRAAVGRAAQVEPGLRTFLEHLGLHPFTR